MADSKFIKCAWLITAFLSCTGLVESAWGAPTFSAYLDRSYYTTEPAAVILCCLDAPADAPTGKEIVVTDADGQVLANGSKPGVDTRITVAIDDLPIGEQLITVTVLAHGGQPIVSRNLSLIKRVPKPGCEWKVDRINRVILRNGKPFFPHGVIMAGSDADYQAAAEIGFNTVHTWMRGNQPERATEYIRSAARHQVVTIINIDGFCRGVELDTLKELVSGEELEQAQKAAVYAGRSPKKFTYGVSHPPAALKKLSDEAQTRLVDEYYVKNEVALTEAIGQAKDSPSLLGYCLYDEPASLLGLALGRRFYNRVREVDGYHPSFVVYSSTIPPGDQYVDWMDCLGTDPYWTPGASGSRGNVNYVSKITYLTRKRADQRRQVTWSVPMGEYWSGIRKRAIMPKEQFCQTYLAIIHGAKAITFFRWPFQVEQTRQTHTRLCKQMKLIGPIAVTPDIPQIVKYDPGKFDPENDNYPDVQVSLRHNPAGGYVLLAANSRYYPVDVTYRISLLGDGGQVKRLFDLKEYEVNGDCGRDARVPKVKRLYEVQDGVFTDPIEFLGTRAYAFNSNVPLNGPVEISVEMKAHADQVDPVYGAPGLPDTGRPEMKNLLRNPGFEEAGLPGWPDYYLLTATGPRPGRPGSETGYGLDTENPYEGKSSLWMCVAGEGAKRFYGACSPQLKEKTPFVLSAHMRADRDNVKVRFVGFGWRVPQPTFGYKEFTLTTKWQRFSEKGTLITGLPPWHSVGVEILADQDATVFFDALQFEKGTELTDYEP